MNKKAVLLLSGGLDSILAGKMIKDQGIALEALNFVTIFCNCTSRSSCKNVAVQASQNLGIPLRMLNVTEEYLEVIKNPRHGYGSSANPCIDCRIFMFKKAKEYMVHSGASFIITGEVLGERPMSQRRPAIELIEKESGLDGLILRPLSAKLFPPTEAEKEGIVDREKLLAIQGRQRREQIDLAKKLEINEYPCPAGGCLLSDKIFGNKIKDLIAHNSLSLKNAMLLKFGRHFRVSDTTKIIVGRDEADNNQLLNAATCDDIILEPKEIAGPNAIITGKNSQGFVDIAARFVARYSDNPKKEEVEIVYWQKNSEDKKILSAKPIEEVFIEKTKIE